MFNGRADFQSHLVEAIKETLDWLDRFLGPVTVKRSE
jgi:hypothetical protein